MVKWIDVKRRNPPVGTTVIVGRWNGVASGRIEANGKVFINGRWPGFEIVTHWQPLPKPPKGKKGKV